ncbi:MAG: hypothetical protein K0R36_998 [Chryseobacterium sp.]|jgi:hypothetical protein|nr:hypothetical protein [Chryseobacterium sp.]
MILEILFELIFFKLPVFIYRKSKLLLIKRNKVKKTKLTLNDNDLHFLPNDKSTKTIVSLTCPHERTF